MGTPDRFKNVCEDYEKGRLEELLDSEGGEELFKMYLMGKMLGAI